MSAQSAAGQSIENAMERDLFAEHLDRATGEARATSERLFADWLPDDCLYVVDPNCSGWGPEPNRPLTGDEEVLRPPGEYVGPLDRPGVVDYLWRDGKVPAWASVMVCAADARCTYLLLRCSPVYSSLESYRSVWGATTPFTTRFLTPPGYELNDDGILIDRRTGEEANSRYTLSEALRERRMPDLERLICLRSAAVDRPPTDG